MGLCSAVLDTALHQRIVTQTPAVVCTCVQWLSTRSESCSEESDLRLDARSIAEMTRRGRKRAETCAPDTPTPHAMRLALAREANSSELTGAEPPRSCAASALLCWRSCSSCLRLTPSFGRCRSSLHEFATHVHLPEVCFNL